MKKLILSLLFFITFSGLYAQKTAPKLTLEQVHQLNGDIEKKPAETFQKFATEGFVFTNGNGKSYNKTELLSVYNYMIQDKHETSEEKIQQIGNTAIITGKIHQRFLQKTDRKLVNDYMGVFTYTFVFQNNNWMMAAAQHTDFRAPKAEGEATDFQKPFTKETLNEILEEYKTDSKAFFNKYLSSDFRYTNQMGSYQYQKEFLGGTAQSIVATEILQPVIFQSGDLATVSGLHQTIRSTKDGSQQTSHDAATYTFQRRAGKWMFVASQQIPLAAPAADDETAIKSVLEGETVAFKQRYESKALSYWSNAPYVSHYYSAPGSGYVRGDKLAATYLNFLKTNPEVDNSPTDFHDYIIRVNGNAAWATWISDRSSNNKKIHISFGILFRKN